MGTGARLGILGLMIVAIAVARLIEVELDTSRNMAPLVVQAVADDAPELEGLGIEQVEDAPPAADPRSQGDAQATGRRAGQDPDLRRSARGHPGRDLQEGLRDQQALEGDPRGEQGRGPQARGAPQRDRAADPGRTQVTQLAHQLHTFNS